MDMESEKGKERKILSRDGAKQQAEDFRDSGQIDPFPEISPSLLSGDHIRDYVMATGAIAPFYIDGGRHSRLKKASYEGRIGRNAYVYNKKGRLEGLELVEHLKVEANSIVFVESDLDFRLPDFIALRFNLQIRHVHRGLLLGTGPLVDPGYWGKLCIPLHNLTDENYSIPLDDGLIWVEFTKTTVARQTDGTEPRRPLDLSDKKEGYWDIREFIDRAARPRNSTGESISIRSSISKVRERAENAESSAEIAKRSATDARNEASRMSARITVGGFITALLLVIGIATFIFTVYNSLAPRIDDLQSRFSRVGSVSIYRDLQKLPVVSAELKEEIRKLQKRIGDLEKMISEGQEASR